MYCLKTTERSITQLLIKPVLYYYAVTKRSRYGSTQPKIKRTIHILENQLAT